MGCTCKSFTILNRLSHIAGSPPLISIAPMISLWITALFGFSFFPFSPPVPATLIFAGSRLCSASSLPRCASSSLSTNFVSRRLLIPLLPPLGFSSSFFQFLQASILSLHLPANHPLSLKIYKKPSECIRTLWLFAAASFPPLWQYLYCIYIIVPWVFSRMWMGPLGDHTT